MSNVINEPIDLRNRTLVFSRDMLRYLKRLRLSKLEQPIADQLVRSVMSVGANFIEAKNASSKKDFRAKVFICKK